MGKNVELPAVVPIKPTRYIRGLKEKNAAHENQQSEYPCRPTGSNPCKLHFAAISLLWEFQWSPVDGPLEQNTNSRSLFESIGFSSFLL